MRIGHEWSGTVSAPVGAGVDEAWLGSARVTGDTMLGCGALRAVHLRAAARLRRPVQDRHPQRLARGARRASCPYR